MTDTHHLAVSCVGLLSCHILLLSFLFFFSHLRRHRACESGAAAPGGDQSAGHGPGRGHLQRSGYSAAGAAGPVCHLLQETAAGEEAQR